MPGHKNQRDSVPWRTNPDADDRETFNMSRKISRTAMDSAWGRNARHVTCDSLTRRNYRVHKRPVNQIRHSDIHRQLARDSARVNARAQIHIAVRR